ncbi:MAG TPA: TetR/AcrR family transcriptional regulator [Azospirillaceae bacterium]|nr:TetR/AcrR family transcriptional regulator [Azospirillaceae bacterium]
MSAITAKAEPGSKHAQILAAARQLFLEQGYETASMDAISKAAKVSKATLYAHFTGKEQLFAAIVACECDDYRRKIMSAAVERPDVREGLLEIGRRFLKMLVSPHVLSAHRMIIAESPRFPELGRAFYDNGPARTIAQLSDYLRQVEERGQLRMPDPVLAAEQFLGMIKVHVHLRHLLGIDTETSDAEVERTVTAAVDMFLRGYAP